jgi:hypothetical protein
MAAGTSSTKQVYPPSLAGSNTAVIFMLPAYHGRVAREPRTPEELLDLIEAKGKEVAEAVAALRSEDSAVR